MTNFQISFSIEKLFVFVTLGSQATEIIKIKKVLGPKQKIPTYHWKGQKCFLKGEKSMILLQQQESYEMVFTIKTIFNTLRNMYTTNKLNQLLENQ